MGLVLELGTGDEGGEGRVYRYTGGHFVKTWDGPVTQEGTRGLTLSALGDLVISASGGGEAVIYGLEGGGLWHRGDLRTTMSGALVLMPGPSGSIEVVAGAGGRGSGTTPIRVSPLGF